MAKKGAITSETADGSYSSQVIEVSGSGAEGYQDVFCSPNRRVDSGVCVNENAVANHCRDKYGQRRQEVILLPWYLNVTY